MPEEDQARDLRLLLSRLAASDDVSVRTVLTSWLIGGSPASECALALDQRTRWLVQLAALLVLDAATESLRWAADLARTSGADDAVVAAVLVAAGSAAGSAQVVAAAPRLALALGLEPPEADLTH